MIDQHRLAALAATSALAVIGLLAVAAPAAAHNELRSSSPVQGARLITGPDRVVLEFGERLDPTFTTIAVTLSGGAPVAKGTPEVTGTRVTQPFTGRLRDGAYTVAYQVVSVDGHPVRGAVSFTVASPATQQPSRPAASIPPQDVTRSPTPGTAPLAGATADPGDDDTPAGLAVGAAAVAALIIGGALMWRRRPRRGHAP